MENQPHGTGALPSPLDVRTFKYTGADKAGEDLYLVGESWAHSREIDQNDQHSVGICTSSSMVMKAQKHFEIKFSEDFQYLLQKTEIDGNWNEGSSALSACKVGNKFGFLPMSEWTHTKESDRKLPYSKYIAKLKKIPKHEIERLKAIAFKYRIEAYAKIANNTEAMAAAISENGSLISRFVIGEEWYSRNMKPETPLRNPKNKTSGHLVNITKRHGSSYRIANSWGTDWADGGTAYGIYGVCTPTEMWQIWFKDVPKEIQNQQENREKLQGQILDLLQQVIGLLQKLKSTT